MICRKLAAWPLGCGTLPIGCNGKGFGMRLAGREGITSSPAGAPEGHKGEGQGEGGTTRTRMISSKPKPHPHPPLRVGLSFMPFGYASGRGGKAGVPNPESPIPALLTHSAWRLPVALVMRAGRGRARQAGPVPTGKGTRSARSTRAAWVTDRPASSTG